MNEADALAAADRFAEQAGIPFTAWQRKVLAAALAEDREEVEYLAWWEEPPPPPPPPSNWTKAKRWFNRVVLRRRHGQSLSNFDAALKDIYAPGLRDAINQSNPLMARIKSYGDLKPGTQGRTAVWTIKDEAVDARGHRLVIDSPEHDGD